MNDDHANHKPNASSYTKDQLRFMRMALTLARKAHGHAEPNPMVGAVIVRDNVVLGKGYHQRFGQPHAEVNAIADAKKHGRNIVGAQMYVTLEPCSHWGKTPPCAEAVIQAKLGSVFCAMQDPFPQVAGKGMEHIRSKGIQVNVGLLEDEARELNGPWFKRLAHGLPWVTLKWAQSIDGKIAASSGDSQWISGPGSRKIVHQMRGRCDAVMVGIGTALADDPQLTARDVKPRRLAQRVVIDPHLKLPEICKLLTPDKHGRVQRVILAVHQQTLDQQADKVCKLEAMGVELVGLNTAEPNAPSAHGSKASAANANMRLKTTPTLTSPLTSPLTLKLTLDLRPLFKHLADAHDITNVLVEGGGRLHGSLLQQQLVDQLMVFVSPKIIGDNQAPSGVAGLTCPQMTQALPLKLHKTKQVGQDMLLDYRVR